MAYIVLTIVGLLSLILVKKEWQEKRQFIFVGFIIIMAALLYIPMDIFVLHPEIGISKGWTDILSKVPWLDIGLYFSMMAGMACKYLFDAIGEKKRKKIKFNKWQFIKPFIVSPIIFAVVYSTRTETTSTFLLLIFAYQNGFFWQTILYKTVNDQEKIGK